MNIRLNSTKTTPVQPYGIVCQKNKYIMNTIFKRLSMIFLMLSCLITLKAQESTRNEIFKAGADKYAKGDFEGALAEWSAIYKTGYTSAELMYNMGNACFKLNDTPNSILYFERAALLDPTDEDINYNLNIARTLTVDKFETIPELFFVRWFNVLSLFMPSNSWAIISILSFVFCLACLAIYFLTSRYKIKVASFWVAILLLLTSILSLSSSIRNKNLLYDNRSAIIFSPQISGKSSPDDSGTDLFVLHEGTKVDVVDKEGVSGWIEIRLSDGNKGWVPASSVEII